MIKKIIKKIIPAEKRLKLRNQQSILNWYLSGKKNLPSTPVKNILIKKIALKNKVNIFIETGTAGGLTVENMSKLFDKIISIEIYEPLAMAAQKKFAQSKHIEIIHGDSGEVFPDILNNINEPILFWLDGHYSGENTGKGSLETPIIKELAAIFSHPIKNHIILIDDARCFDGTHDYPEIKDLKKFIKEKKLNLNFDIKHDMIIIK